MLIVCILLALLCAGLAFWVWAQRRSLREAAYRLRALEDTGSTARVRLAVPNGAAEALLDEVNRLLELRDGGGAAGILGGDCGAGQGAPEPDYQLL